MRWFQQPRPVILFASLVANLFFAGLIATAVIQRPPPPEPPSPSVRYLMKAAGPEVKPLFEDAFAARREDMDAARAALREARVAFEAALRSDPLDVEALRASLDARREAGRDLRRVFDEVYLDVVPTLTPDARREMADMRRPRRDGKKDRWDRDRSEQKAKD